MSRFKIYFLVSIVCFPLGIVLLVLGITAEEPFTQLGLGSVGVITIIFALILLLAAILEYRTRS